MLDFESFALSLTPEKLNDIQKSAQELANKVPIPIVDDSILPKLNWKLNMVSAYQTIEILRLYHASMNP